MTDLATRYGKWALVAGASEGLGAAIANAYAAEGLNLVLLARRQALLDERAAALAKAHGVEVRTLAIDLGAPDVWERLAPVVDDIEVGLFVYNAAYEAQGRFLETDLAAHLAGIDVNCRTPAILTWHLGRRMVARGRGSIVLNTSFGALQGMQWFASYSASKAYEWILAEGLWDELREHGVDVLAYVVGSTLTPNFFASNPDAATPAFLAANPMAQTPEEVAQALLRVLDQGPRAFTGPEYERTAAAFAQMRRAEAVTIMGQRARSLGRAGQPSNRRSA